MEQHAAGDQRTLYGPVVRNVQQGADPGDPAQVVSANRDDLHIGDRQLPTGTTDVGRTEPAGRIAVTGPADEILGRDVIEFAAPAAGIEIALVRYFVIQNWHGLIIAQLA